MSNSCPVSDKIVEFLVASPVDEVYSVQNAFEFYHSSEHMSRETLEASVIITRCLDNPDTFLIGNLSFVMFHENGSGHTYNVRPVKGFVEFLGFENKDLPIFDGTHIGPLDAEATLKILEISHACYSANRERKRALLLRDAFRENAVVQVAPVVLSRDASGDGAEVIRLGWNKARPDVSPK